MRGQSAKGVLLINLGSPASPSKKDIRAYLKEFLSDKRVMTMPALLRWMIVNLFIVPFRPSLIKPRYESIWSSEGFPLIYHGNELRNGISAELGNEYHVEIAMRYGKPDLALALEGIRDAGLEKLLVIPLYPQYASATTGSTLERVMTIMKDWQVFPELEIISNFYQHPVFIASWKKIIEPYLTKTPQHILFSFHGLPESHILAADPSGSFCLKSEDCCRNNAGHVSGCYRAQCFQTADRIAEALTLKPEQFSISFQSRLGKAKWLEPYTIERVRELAEQGLKHILVICPSFVADCLETTEEISVEVKKVFLDSGGETLDLVPSLNSDQTWIKGLASIIRDKL